MKTNKLSAWSFWLSIIGLFLYQFSIIPILAVILGIAATIQINKDKTKGLGMSIWAIALGLLGLMFRIFLGK